MNWSFLWCLQVPQCCIQVIINGNLKEAVEVDVENTLREVNDDVQIFLGSNLYSELLPNSAVLFMLRFKLNIRVHNTIGRWHLKREIISYLLCKEECIYMAYGSSA